MITVTQKINKLEERMKKSVILTTVLISSMFLTACGNKDHFSTKYEFKTAQIKMLDGTIKNVKVKSWSRDEKANNIRITTTDGTSYYTSSENIILIDK